jgi:hypothetical protein
MENYHVIIVFSLGGDRPCMILHRALYLMVSMESLNLQKKLSVLLMTLNWNRLLFMPGVKVQI